MSETGFITIAGVLERDTDLLLLEVFIASHDLNPSVVVLALQ